MGRLKHKQNPWCLEFLAPSTKLHIYPKSEMWIGLNEFAQLMNQPTHCCEKSSLSSADASKSHDRTLQHASNCLSHHCVPYLVVYGDQTLAFSFVYFRQRASEIREKNSEHEKRTQMGSVH
ncbi:hypothetical protein NC653_001662 [Populus alba x Populus x berolinensis]|uniref:Uncharacterized protein n=1 Tax=Populus alba x Populus x berolinensis TaxID=444605 RepID=A0AAD6RLZ6_9ROSI|nr:hypothetical protein NC653_001662 [Populus alba x Populus x berolinensis]